jgi:magnesium transporter
MSLREGTSYTSIGIVIAISGNILISLALNIQKRAHAQVSDSRTATPNRTPALSRQASANNGPNIPHYDLADTRPLLPTSTSSPRPAYGSTKALSFFGLRKASSRVSEPSTLSPTAESVHDQDDDELEEVSPGTETDYLRSKLWYTLLHVLSLTSDSLLGGLDSF